MNNNQTTQPEYPTHERMLRERNNFRMGLGIKKPTANGSITDYLLDEYEHLQARLKQAVDALEVIEELGIKAMTQLTNGHRPFCAASEITETAQNALANYQVNKEQTT